MQTHVGRTVRKSGRIAADRATGLPGAEECESLPSTWITPARAPSSSILGPRISSGSAAAVTCTERAQRDQPVAVAGRAAQRDDVPDARSLREKPRRRGSGCRLLQAPVERPRSRPDEDPTCPNPRATRRQLGVVEAVQRGHRHLTSGEDSRGTARDGERRGQLPPSAPAAHRSARHGRGGYGESRRSPRCRHPAPGAPLRPHRQGRGRRRPVPEERGSAIDRDMHRNGHGRAGSNPARRTGRAAATSTRNARP